MMVTFPSWLANRAARRRVALAGAASAAIAFGAITVANYRIARCAGQAFDSVQAVPARPVAVVLGCSKTTLDRPNRFYVNRLEACAELYRSGKVSAILVSGDHGRSDYNEPADMRDDLMALGVPEEAIHCDYAGFSTLDSVVRAHEVFGLSEFIVVSQRFQCERAIYIGNRHGLDVVGYCAADVKGPFAAKTYAREYLARTKAWFDVNVWDREPKYLGPPIHLLS